MNFPEEVEDALLSGSTVTVVLENGRTFTGTLAEHPTRGAGWLTIRTGSRGRPPVFHVDDVTELIFE